MSLFSFQFVLDYGKLTLLMREISANKNTETNWTTDGILEALRKKLTEQYALLLNELKSLYCAEIFDTLKKLLDQDFKHILPVIQVISAVNETNGKLFLLIFEFFEYHGFIHFFIDLDSKIY